MHAQKEHITKTLQKEMNPEFYDGISQLIFELMIETPDFLNNIENNYLDYIYKNHSQKRCDLLYYSNINKHKVDKFLKYKKSNINVCNEKTGTNFHNFLEILEKECKKLPDQIISFSDKKQFVSFKSIFERCGLGNAGYSPKAIKLSLIEAGCINEMDDGSIQFLSTRSKPITNLKDTVRRISNTFQRYVSNVFANNKARDNNEKVVLFEQAMVSDTIPEHMHDETFAKLRQYYEPKFFEGKPILEEHENDNLQKTHAVGYQLFFFKTKL